MEKRALGKGLSALIPPKEVATATKEAVDNKDVILEIAVSEIHPNKYQPRIDFNQEKLNELVESIREKGIIQPVLVRKAGAGYELIAGERRWRAAKSLGLEKVPAIVKDVEDLDMLELSLIENIQREDLNPMEEAESLQKFITDFNFTQERIAKVIGKDRSTVANILRLLGLPKKAQEFLSKNIITMGHAKAILSLPNEMEQMRVCTLVAKKGLSVRQTEELAASRIKEVPGKAKELPKKEPAIADIEEKLQHSLGTRVKIAHGKKRGVIKIEYYSYDDLSRIVKKITPNILTD